MPFLSTGQAQTSRETLGRQESWEQPQDMLVTRLGSASWLLTGPEDLVLAGGPPERPCLRDRVVSAASREI